MINNYQKSNLDNFDFFNSICEFLSHKFKITKEKSSYFVFNYKKNIKQDSSKDDKKIILKHLNNVSFDKKYKEKNKNLMEFFTMLDLKNSVNYLIKGIA
jgi:hypothetical protein